MFDRNKHRESRLDWLREIRNVPCMDCGGRFPAVCMDFDHRPDEVKLFGIMRNYELKKETLEAEIAKCDIVCANCHHIRTADIR